MVVIDDFDGGVDGNKVGGWSVDTSNHLFYEAGQDFAGGQSAHATLTDSDGSGNGDPQGQKDLPGGAEQISSLQFYYRETSGSQGHGVRLKNSNGKDVIGAQTNNPSWVVYDNNGFTSEYNGDGYDRWVRVKFIFNWNNNTVDIEWEDQAGGNSDVFTGRPMINAVDIQQVRLETYNNGAYYNASATNSFWDEITYDPGTADVTLTGQVTLNGSPVQGAVVYAFDNTDKAFVGNTTTDSNGNYSIVPSKAVSGNEVLISVDHDTGSGRFGEEKSTVV